MRQAGLLAMACIAVSLASVAERAEARISRRSLCARFQCATVVQDPLVRILRVRSRHPEHESESEQGHKVHYAVWKPSGSAWPLGDYAVELDSSFVERLVLVGSWVAYEEGSCSHETDACFYAVRRLNARTGVREENPPRDPGTGPFLQPTPGCAALEEATRDGITALLLTDSGTIAWIENRAVCELPHDSSVPLELAHGPPVAPYPLRQADAQLYWREGSSTHSAPLP